MVLGGGEVWGGGCLRTYRGGRIPRLHNHVARALRMVGLCRLPPGGACSSYGSLLDGVDVYVIELPRRAGRVGGQAHRYGIGKHQVNVVTGMMPSTSPCDEECGKIAAECAQRAESWERANGARRGSGAFAAAGEPLRPLALSSKVVACALSHIKALQQACANPLRTQNGHVDVALVLEDDADFGPLEHWPQPLSTLLSTLPKNWTIVNAAPSNVNDGLKFGRSSQFFRPGHLDTAVYDIGRMDYGAVAVVYNLANPVVCSMANGHDDSRHGSPVEFMRSAQNMCEPSDMMLYRELGGFQWEHMYVHRATAVVLLRVHR